MRDNLHSADLVDAFLLFHAEPAGRPPSTTSAAGRDNACSMLEAIEICERIAGRELRWELSDEARIGDHRWWISDLDEFGSAPRRLAPASATWRRSCARSHEANAERWASAPA